MKPYVIKQSESAVPAGTILLFQKQVHFFERTPCDAQPGTCWVGQPGEPLWFRAEGCTSSSCFTFSTEKVQTFPVGHMTTKLCAKFEDNDLLASLLICLFCTFQQAWV